MMIVKHCYSETFISWMSRVDPAWCTIAISTIRLYSWKESGTGVGVNILHAVPLRTMKSLTCLKKIEKLFGEGRKGSVLVFVVPVSTGGFGAAGSGALEIANTTTGTLFSDTTAFGPYATVLYPVVARPRALEVV
jgi:hypothetical protein